MFLVVDTETTGLIKRKIDSSYSHVPHLVQLSWILYDGEKVIEEKDFVIKPEGFFISSVVSRIHGITQQYAMKYGHKLETVLTEFERVLKNKDLTLVGHNINFDSQIIEAELWRKQFDCFKDFANLTKICTMRQAANYCKLPSKISKTQFKMPNLQELHFKLFDEDFENAHNSLYDARACLRCFTKLKQLQVV